MHRQSNNRVFYTANPSKTYFMIILFAFID